MQQKIHTLRLHIAAYYELTKPGVTFMVLISAMVGYYLGLDTPLNMGHMTLTLLGIGLVAGGTSALNQVIESNIDARMTRTRKRPIPTGRISRLEGLAFGVSISVAGIGLLYAKINTLTALLAAATLLSYVFIYTPMKRKTTLSTLVGAVPGALPPVGGWAAARGDASWHAWVLFGVLFFWQLPHFLAIAWLYKEDYARGGIRVLPLSDPYGAKTIRQIILNCVALLAISLLPTVFGWMGAVYAFGAAALGLGYLYSGWLLARTRTNRQARQVLFASILYLPLLLALMTVHKLLA